MGPDAASNAYLATKTQNGQMPKTDKQKLAFGGALTDAATVTADVAEGSVFTLLIGGNRTLAVTGLGADQVGCTYMWIITQDGTGSRTLAYSSAFTWPAGAAPTLSTAAGAVDIITAVYDGLKLRAVAQQNFA